MRRFFRIGVYLFDVNVGFSDMRSLDGMSEVSPADLTSAGGQRGAGGAQITPRRGPLTARTTPQGHNSQFTIPNSGGYGAQRRASR
jgi:hypothetical protein